MRFPVTGGVEVTKNDSISKWVSKPDVCQNSAISLVCSRDISARSPFQERTRHPMFHMRWLSKSLIATDWDLCKCKMRPTSHQYVGIQLYEQILPLRLKHPHYPNQRTRWKPFGLSYVLGYKLTYEMEIIWSLSHVRRSVPTLSFLLSS